LREGTQHPNLQRRIGLPRELALKYLPEEGEKRIFITSALYPAFVKWTTLVVLFLFVIVSVSVGSTLLQRMSFTDLLTKAALFFVAVLAVAGATLLIFSSLSEKGLILKKKSKRLSSHKVRMVFQMIAGFVIVVAALYLISLPFLFHSEHNLRLLLTYIGILLMCHAVLLFLKITHTDRDTVAYQQLDRDVFYVNLLLFPAVFAFIVDPDLVLPLISHGAGGTSISQIEEMFPVMQTLLLLWMVYVVARRLWFFITAHFLSSHK
jgi:cytochrome c oxidase assembly factor CtaG